MDPVRCDACGRELKIGDYPFCPHGSGTNNVIQDEIPGGQWFENGFKHPRKFYSHSAHRAALAAEGKEIVVRHAGEHERHVTKWDAVIDAKTLENVRVLLSRGSVRVEAPDDANYPITTRVISGPVPEGVTHG